MFRFAWLAAPIVVLVACATEVKTVAGPAPVYESADAGTSKVVTAKSPTEPEPEAEAEPVVGAGCDAYLDCVAEVTPRAAAAAVAAYGSTSPCWKGSAKEAAACEKACTSALSSCRSEACELTEGAACVSCCAALDPKATAAFKATYLATLDEVACKTGACDSTCCDRSSVACRQCVQESFPESADAACDDDKACDAMASCVASCDSNEEHAELKLGL